MAASAIDRAFAALATPALVAVAGEPATYTAPVSGAAPAVCTVIFGNQTDFAAVTVANGAEVVERATLPVYVRAAEIAAPARDGRFTRADGTNWTIRGTPIADGSGFWVCECEAEIAPRVTPTRARHG